METLKGLRLGVDAVFWLRSIQALKDPFADALGGIPPGIFGFVDKELEYFKKSEITPFFVFQGVAPGPQHSMFVSRMDTQMEAAWSFLGKGMKSEAQKCFAVSTSRINGDFVYFIFHHLRHKGYECLQAPYFAGAQLTHFAEKGVVQAVFGPPGLLLYGVQGVIIHLHFQQSSFHWVDLNNVLTKWKIDRDQFVDACMLAGTEYCLTYPYLNLSHFHPTQQKTFNFDAAVHIIKQAPLINWMQTFPTEDMKNDHVDGYCICKVLVRNSPVLHMTDSIVRPLGESAPGAGGRNEGPQVPSDFSTIMGEKLPNSMYYLMLNGIISHKLPQALAKGEWTDKSQPLVDTQEFRVLLQDLQDYRETALGLIARHLNRGFQEKRILMKSFWESHPIRTSISGSEANLPTDARIIQPRCPMQGLAWNVQKDAVDAELRRQGTNSVDIKFCLNWHRNEFQSDGPLVKGLLTQGRYPTCSNDLNSLCALVHLMVLENLDLISGLDGGLTVLGNTLCETPTALQEPCLVALEMMKFGILTGEPFDAPEQTRPFPEQVNYPRAPAEPRKKAEFLLSRVMSLVPMKLKNDMWNADVFFDLAAFHSMVRVLKRTLRQIVEACLTSVLLTDLQKVKLLPPGFMCASPKKDNHMEMPAVLPTFMLPRACMGIVVVHFLQYDGDAMAFQRHLESKFTCCAQPLEDLQNAIQFWNDLARCVEEIAEPLEAQELLQDIKSATEVLMAQKRNLRI
jgi:hypothetical protein